MFCAARGDSTPPAPPVMERSRKPLQCLRLPVAVALAGLVALALLVRLWPLLAESVSRPPFGPGGGTYVAGSIAVFALGPWLAWAAARCRTAQTGGGWLVPLTAGCGVIGLGIWLGTFSGRVPERFQGLPAALLAWSIALPWIALLEMASLRGGGARGGLKWVRRTTVGAAAGIAGAITLGALANWLMPSLVGMGTALLLTLVCSVLTLLLVTGTIIISAYALAQPPEPVGVCPACGYDLRGTPADGPPVCSECGRPFERRPPPPPSARRMGRRAGAALSCAGVAALLLAWAVVDHATARATSTWAASLATLSLLLGIVGAVVAWRPGRDGSLAGGAPDNAAIAAGAAPLRWARRAALVLLAANLLFLTIYVIDRSATHRRDARVARETEAMVDRHLAAQGGAELRSYYGAYQGLIGKGKGGRRTTYRGMLGPVPQRLVSNRWARFERGQVPLDVRITQGPLAVRHQDITTPRYGGNVSVPARVEIDATHPNFRPDW